jgi:hypothetical protein
VAGVVIKKFASVFGVAAHSMSVNEMLLLVADEKPVSEEVIE